MLDLFSGKYGPIIHAQSKTDSSFYTLYKVRNVSIIIIYKLISFIK